MSLVNRIRLGSSCINGGIRTMSTFNKNYNKDEKCNDYRNHAVIGTAFAGFLAIEIYRRFNKPISLEPLVTKCSAGLFKNGLPNYTLEEVSKHCTIEDRVWVSFKQGVYDVTDFIAKHPGGEQIMLAAGSSVEPFWLLYAAHNNMQVHEILESMRIGNLSVEEAQVATKDMSDPYVNDPIRHRVLKPASVKPFNAEPPSSLLVDSFITPAEIFYVRNHLPVPEVDPKTYELEIECEGKKKSLNLSLDKLKQFPKHSVIASIMCAGNRRSEMTTTKPVKGLSWQNGAIANAQWSGARLRDVLKAAGVNEDSDEYKHIQFEGLDTDPTNKPYGASIPFWKGIDKRGDVILAYEMNGQPIPRDHGFPIRVIVPGVVGARNVKWLGKIICSAEESDSHWQQNDYKGFSPSTDWDTVDFTKSPAIQELPVISSICKPSVNDNVSVIDGHITVQGYAWSGGGQRIVRVDITIDEGETWHVATLEHQDQSAPPQHWAWTLWTVKIPVPKNTEKVEIWSKAVDSCYNTQPESFKNIWNLRGVLSNAYHRVPITLKW